MITLDTTTKSVEVILPGAITTNQLDITAAYVDVNTSDQSVAAIGENDTVTNGGTAVTAVAAPGSGKTRTVKHISVTNNDTVAQTVTVRINNNGTFRRLCKVTLQIDETLEYNAED